MASPHSSAQIRLLLVEDVPQVTQYIRNLLSAREAQVSRDVMHIARTLTAAATPVASGRTVAGRG